MSDGRSSAWRWLVLGACAGVAIAAASLVRGGGGAEVVVPPGAGDVVALVNGVPITQESLARFASAVARDRGRLDLDPAERRRLLSRLIDEELLLQRGITLDLPRREQSARSAIVTAMVDSLTSAEASEPTREDLEAFLRESPGSFVRPGRVTIEAVRVPLDLPTPADAPARAAEVARRAKAGESLAVIGAELAAPIDPPLPSGPISIDALRDRAGGIVVQAVSALTPGETSEPVRAMDGYWVVHLAAREPDFAPPLEQIYEPVRQAWTLREHERRLGEALAQMRAEAKVEIVDPELAEP